MQGDVCRIVPTSEAVPASKTSFTLFSLLGDQLKGKEGTINTSSVKSKYVGLYFSAHWCPPCRGKWICSPKSAMSHSLTPSLSPPGFTPKLAEFYKAFQLNHADEFEIVFISSDKDQVRAASIHLPSILLHLPSTSII